MKKLLLLFLISLLLFIPTSEAKTPFSSKPPLGATIDWSHPCAKGLIGCWLMNERTGTITRNLALGKSGTISGHTWKSGKSGPEIILSGTSSSINSLHSFRLTDKFTVITRFYQTNIDLYDAICSDYDNAVGDEGWGIRVNNAGTGQYVFNQGGAGGFEGVIIFTLLNNNWHNIAVKKNGNAIRYYADGTFANATGTKAISASQYNFRIGSDKAGASNINATFVFMYLYKDVISDDKIKYLFSDPYCFIKPQTDWGCIQSAVVGAVRRILFIQ